MAIVKPKPKKLRLANHSKRKKRNEPIRARSKSTQSVPNAGKCAEATIGYVFAPDWFKKLLWLVELDARFFNQL